MKKVWLMSICMVLVMTCAAVHAQEKAPLGNGNFAVKVDYIAFTHDHWSDSGDDEGIYLGLEGYFEVAPNWSSGERSAPLLTLISTRSEDFLLGQY